ncbi:MAG: CBS domain-containing protein [Promethearchaeota archaeon]
MDLKEMTAKDIMSTDITVIRPMEKVTTAEMMMIKKNIGGLPVVSDKEKLIGILTQRDIQLSRSIIGTEAFHVDDLYSKNPVKAEINENLPSIIKKMNENNIERIPIVNGNDHVVGIVVTKDIIKALGDYFQKI